jgi:hypothetical protein
MKRPVVSEQIEVLDRSFADVLRRKSFAERLAMVRDANRFLRLRIAGQLCADHPDWNEGQISKEIARRISSGAS